jgi:hypothetical protein
VLEQVAHRGAPARALEQLVERALLWRAGEDALAVQERLDVVVDAGDALAAHGRLGVRRAGERHGSAARSATPRGTA